MSAGTVGAGFSPRSAYRVVEPVKYSGLIRWPGDEIVLPEDHAAVLIDMGVVVLDPAADRGLKPAPAGDRGLKPAPTGRRRIAGKPAPAGDRGLKPAPTGVEHGS